MISVEWWNGSKRKRKHGTYVHSAMDVQRLINNESYAGEFCEFLGARGIIQPFPSSSAPRQLDDKQPVPVMFLLRAVPHDAKTVTSMSEHTSQRPNRHFPKSANRIFRLSAREKAIWIWTMSSAVRFLVHPKE